MQKIYFYEIDDCIIAAYNHVKRTGYKMSLIDTNWIIGMKSEDNILFAMSKTDYNNSKKRKLVETMKGTGAKILDIINKQLMVWL